MDKINLLVIGAGRSGTTSLCHYFKNHLEICFSNIKEVHYFSIEDLYNRGNDYLHSYFQYSNEKIIGTADTYLLIDQEAPKRVYNYNPDIKIIVMLREPVSRAFSSYHYAINNGYQNKEESFVDSSKLEDSRINNLDIIQKNNLCHIEGSLYYKNLQQWTEYFPKESILLIKTEELGNDYKSVLDKVASFLEIKNFEVSKEVYINKASPVKSKGLQQFLLNRNHPLRKWTRPIAKPLKYLINKSGIINLLYKLNKTEKPYNPIDTQSIELTEKYFKKDLELLYKNYKISFK